MHDQGWSGWSGQDFGYTRLFESLDAVGADVPDASHDGQVLGLFGALQSAAELDDGEAYRILFNHQDVRLEPKCGCQAGAVAPAHALDLVPVLL